TSQANACMRRSVDVSTRTYRTAAANAERSVGHSSAAEGGNARVSSSVDAWISMRMDGLVRRSLGSLERHTPQSQPIIGTPCEVPVPSRVTLRLNRLFPAASDLHESKPQFVQDLLEYLTLLGAEVTSGLLVEERKNVNHLLGALEILGCR